MGKWRVPPPRNKDVGVVAVKQWMFPKLFTFMFPSSVSCLALFNNVWISSIRVLLIFIIYKMLGGRFNEKGKKKSYHRDSRVYGIYTRWAPRESNASNRKVGSNAWCEPNKNVYRENGCKGWDGSTRENGRKSLLKTEWFPKFNFVSNHVQLSFLLPPLPMIGLDPFCLCSLSFFLLSPCLRIMSVTLFA